jgi:hypothetical protein
MLYTVSGSALLKVFSASAPLLPQSIWRLPLHAYIHVTFPLGARPYMHIYMCSPRLRFLLDHSAPASLTPSVGKEAQAQSDKPLSVVTA